MTLTQPVSKIGGIPWLPSRTLPACAHCRHPLTFYVQLVVGDELHSLFSCTKCSSDEDVFPLMPEERQSKIHVPVAHARLDSSWNLMISQASATTPCVSYPALIAEVILRHDGRHLHAGNFLYGMTAGDFPWNLRAPKPQALALSDSSLDALDFAFYLFPDYQYAVVEGAPRQIGYSPLLRSEVPYRTDLYDLFLQGTVYAFVARKTRTPYLFSTKE